MLAKSVARECAGSKVGVHRLQPGMVMTELLVKDLDEAAKPILDILAEEPATVATFLATKVCGISGNDQHIPYLTPLGVFWRFSTFFLRRNRFFDADGNLLNKNLSRR